MFNKIKHSIKLFFYKIVPPPYTNESFSQAGEDCIIDFLLSQVGISEPKYLELGVYHPTSASNTYRFYKNGANGVLVEADKTLIPEIKKIRNRDIVLNVGVGDGELVESEFYIFEEPAHNTFSKSEAEYREQNGSYKIIDVVKVKLKTVNEIISENFKSTYPDILSIDIEGLDLSVLKSLNFERFPIPIICAETCKYSENHIKPKDLSIIDFMLSRGYFVYADTYINTIFVNKEWFEKKEIKK